MAKSQTRILDDWLSILGSCFTEAPNTWLSKAELLKCMKEKGDLFDGVPHENLNADQQQSLDKSISEVLHYFSCVRLIRVQSRQEFTQNLRFPKTVTVGQLTKLGTLIFSCPRSIRIVFFASTDLIFHARNFIRRWWWVIGLAAAFTQLKHAFELFNLAWLQASGWLTYAIGLAIGLLVGVAIRWLIDLIN